VIGLSSVWITAGEIIVMGGLVVGFGWALRRIADLTDTNDRLEGELFTTNQALVSAVRDLRLVDEHRAAHADRLGRAMGGQS